MATKSGPVSQPAADQNSSVQTKPAKRSLFARSSKREPTNKASAPSSTVAAPAAATPAPAAVPATTITAPTPPADAASVDGPSKPDNAAPPTAPSSQPGLAPAATQSAGAAPAAEPSSAQAGPTPASTSIAGPPTPSTPTSVPATSEHQVDDADREKEKDKGSLSTTLTGTHHTRVSRKGAQTGSEGAHSSTTTEQPHTPTPTAKRRPSKVQARRPRPSLVSRLVRVLVPCVGPARLPPDLADDADPKSSGAALREKPPARDVEKDTTHPTQETAAPKDAPAEPPRPPAAEPVASTSAVAAVADEVGLQPLQIPAAPTPPAADKDVDIVVPPTPTKAVPESETGGVTSSAVVPPGSTAEEVAQLRAAQAHESSSGDESDGTSFTEDEEVEDVPGIDEVEDDEDRLILQGGAGIPIGPDGVPRPLLPPILPQHAGRKCLVLDLDETLVHSSFKSIQQADYVVPVEIEYHWHNVYVIKRPGVDNFLKKMGEIYEVVVFTASLSKYADPVLDKLDVHHVVAHRLFRESCYNHKGNYVKDLSQLGRPIADTIILDNSPASYIFHPNNAVPVSSWFNDPHDTELTDLCPFLADLSTTDDVRGVLDGGL